MEESALFQLANRGDIGEDTSVEELREFLRRTYGDDAASRMIVENSVDPETGRQFLALLTEGWGETQSTWAQNWFLGAEHVGALGEHYRTSFSEHDMMLRHKFMSLWQAVKEGECDEWELEGAALVAALALVLDQVTRKLHLNTRDSYAQDPSAQLLVVSVIEAHEDANLEPPVLQALLALPLLHAEDVVLQEQARTYLQRKQTEMAALALCAGLIERMLEACEVNLQALKTFGHFPQRNAAYGRPTSEEEQQFLNSLQGRQALIR